MLDSLFIPLCVANVATLDLQTDLMIKTPTSIFQAGWMRSANALAGSASAGDI